MLSCSEKYAEGEAIEAQYHGNEGGEWYPGKIAAAHVDGTYDIAYDDGDTDKKLSARSIRRKKGGGLAAAAGAGAGQSRKSSLQEAAEELLDEISEDSSIE